MIVLVVTVTLSVMAWIVLTNAIQAWRQGLGTAAGYWIPRWLLLAVMFTGLAPSAAIFLLRLLRPASEDKVGPP